MANRSYLYSTNVVPGPGAKAHGRKLVGISEWKYDIPLVYKLLLSGNPRACTSSIWGSPDHIALVGDYAAGVKHLQQFLAQITLPAAQIPIAQALEFLSRPGNQNPYFVLECGEIFEMEEAPILQQNLALLEEVKNLQPVLQQTLQMINQLEHRQGSMGRFLARVFRRTPEPPTPGIDPMRRVSALGLGHWSNTLYFDFTGD